MPITRRHFIALGAATAVSATLVGTTALVNWWDTTPEEPYQTLDQHEANVLRHFAAASFPSGDTIPLDGGKAQLDRFFDTIVLSMTDENRKLLKLLIQAIDKLSLPLHFSTFSNLPLSTQRELLQMWLAHDNHLIRGAIHSLVLLLGMGYTTHPIAAQRLEPSFRCGFGA